MLDLKRLDRKTLAKALDFSILPKETTAAEEQSTEPAAVLPKPARTESLKSSKKPAAEPASEPKADAAPVGRTAEDTPAPQQGEAAKVVSIDAFRKKT